MNVVSCRHIQKESFEAFDQSPMIHCLIWLLSYEDQFQMHSMYVGTLLQAQSCYLCLVAGTNSV